MKREKTELKVKAAVLLCAAGIVLTGCGKKAETPDKAETAAEKSTETEQDGQKRLPIRQMIRHWLRKMFLTVQM